MLQISDVAVLIVMCATPLFGRAADRVGRKPCTSPVRPPRLVLAFPSFWALKQRHVHRRRRAICGLILPSMAMYTTQGAWFPELFPPQFRVTGSGFGVQLATAALGGPAPTIAQALLRSSHGHSWTVSTYIAGVCFTSLIFAALTPETRPGRRPTMQIETPGAI